jgi:membrane fusion protein (multidrug efflux system)
MTMPFKNALIIPQKATYEIQDRTFVFVIDKRNMVHSKQVSILGRIPDLFVVDGISADDKILLEGVQKVKDDDKVAYDFEEPKEVMAHLRLKAE